MGSAQSKSVVVVGSCGKERRQSQRKLSELSMRSTASALRQQSSRRIGAATLSRWLISLGRQA
jgi:hypothetical protein